MSITAAPVSVNPNSAARGRMVLMMAGATLLSAAAQILMKLGMTHFSLSLLAIVTNLPLIAGYVLYGLFTLLMVLALREGELSLMYPIISLSYVWVTALSYFIFHDTLNPLKLAGIAGIMAGVALLGRGDRQ
ncbi:MAG: EamA family transporter [Bryobacteraceae bacterium]